MQVMQVRMPCLMRLHEASGIHAQARCDLPVLGRHGSAQNVGCAAFSGSARRRGVAY